MAYLNKHLEKECIKRQSKRFMSLMVVRVLLVGIILLLGKYSCMSYKEWRYIPATIGYMPEPGEVEEYKAESIKSMEILLKRIPDEDPYGITYKMERFDLCVREKIREHKCEYKRKYKYELDAEQIRYYTPGYKKECREDSRLPNYAFLSEADMILRIDSLSDKKLVKRCYVNDNKYTYETMRRANRYYPFWLFFWE
jgi:hypothetical protein